MSEEMPEVQDEMTEVMESVEEQEVEVLVSLCRKKCKRLWTIESIRK